MKVIFALGLLTSLSAFAALDEQGYSLAYNCFNRAQLADAPAIDIVSKGEELYLKSSIRSGVRYTQIEGLVRAGTGLTEYDTKSYNVKIGEGPGAGAQVTLKDSGLIYKCEVSTAL